MRVLHLITGLAPGGAEHNLLRLVGAQQAAGIACTVIGLNADDTLAADLRATGASVHSLAWPRLPGPRRWQQLSTRLPSPPATVLHGWMDHGNLAALWLARQLRWRTPLVWGIRQSLDGKARGNLAGALVQRAAGLLSGRADAVVFNAAASARGHQRLGYTPATSHVVRNVLDCQHFRPDPAAGRAARQQLGIAAGDRVLGLMARAHPVKDHHNALAAVVPLLLRHPDLHLLCCGRGVPALLAGLTSPLPAEVRARIHALDHQPDLRPWYNACDLVFLASAWGEALATCLLEAMACARPCVATDLGDSAWLLRRPGAVVPSGDPTALGGALAAVLAMAADTRADIGTAARQQVEAEHGVARILPDWQAIYQAASSHHSRR